MPEPPTFADLKATAFISTLALISAEKTGSWIFYRIKADFKAKKLYLYCTFYTENIKRFAEIPNSIMT